MTRRPLTPEERAAIAARYGATCDVRTVTVLPPGAVTPWDEQVDRWTRQAKRGGQARIIAQSAHNLLTGAMAVCKVGLSARGKPHHDTHTD